MAASAEPEDLARRLPASTRRGGLARLDRRLVPAKRGAPLARRSVAKVLEAYGRSLNASSCTSCPTGGGGETYIDVLDEMPGYGSTGAISPRIAAKALELARGLTVAAGSQRYDVVHVHGEVATGLCLPILVTSSSVVTLHGCTSSGESAGPSKGGGANLRAVLRAAHQTICVSQTEHEELIRAVGPAGEAP